MSRRWIIFQEDETDADVPENQRTWASPEDILTMFDEGSDKEDCPHRIVWITGNKVGRIETAIDPIRAFSDQPARNVCCYIREEDPGSLIVERIVAIDELTVIEPTQAGPFKIHKGGKK